MLLVRSLLAGALLVVACRAPSPDAPVAPEDPYGAALIPSQSWVDSHHVGTVDVRFRPGTRARWFRIDIRETESGPLDVHVDHTGPSDALAVELRKADGRVLGRGCVHDDRAGGCNITVENASGMIYVRVFAPDPHAAGDVTGLQFGFTSYMPAPDGSLPCDLQRVDPRNPACASVIACDPDQPDLSNPACCASPCSSERGCRGQVSRVDQNGSLRWFSLGARDGITRADRARLFYWDDTVEDYEKRDRWFDVRIARVDGHRTLLAIDHPDSAPPGLVDKSEIGFIRSPVGCERDQAPPLE